MKNIILISYCFLISISARAGFGNAILDCKSESGRTTFKAILPGLSWMSEAKFTIDGTTMKFTEDDKSYLILDALSGVFTLYLEGKTDNTYKNHKFIQFWA